MANSLNATLCFDYKDLDKDIDLLLIMVNDNAIETVAKNIYSNIHLQNVLVAHTSGATPMQILAPYAKRFGVFYPLQSFSKNSDLDMNTVPICIDANNENDKSILLILGQLLSNNVAIVNDEQRAYLHVGAVMVNNFTNHLYALAQDFMAKHHTPFSMLKPLILETVHKLEYMPAKAAQTGPAKRNDQNTIQRHLDLIATDKDLALLYKMLSESISKYYL